MSSAIARWTGSPCGTFAAEDELFGLGLALKDAGAGVFELAPAGADGQDLVNAKKEVEWMKKLSAEIARPVTFALLQNETEPNLWREIMEESIQAAEDGAKLYPQIAARPFGLMIGLQTHHPFARRPTFRRIESQSDSIEAVASAMRDPANKAAILSEENLPADPNNLFDGMSDMIAMMLHRLYVIGDPPDYEPTPDRSVAAIAEAQGVEPIEAAYDAFAAGDGTNMLMMPIFNYVDGNHDVIREMITHPYVLSGLSDGGAHCGMICDASIPTFLLTHWARDRSRGEKIDLERIVQKQTKDTAELFGLTDRGTLEVGKKADLNVIDFENLKLRSIKLVNDLPAGGRRLLQKAEGYDYTIVSGEITRKNGEDTGARPGRLVRGARDGPHQESEDDGGTGRDRTGHAVRNLSRGGAALGGFRCLPSGDAARAPRRGVNEQAAWDVAEGSDLDRAAGRALLHVSVSRRADPRRARAGSGRADDPRDRRSRVLARLSLRVPDPLRTALQQRGPLRAGRLRDLGRVGAGDPLHVLGAPDLRSRSDRVPRSRGRPLDLHRSFEVDDDPEEMSNFLRQTGFLVVRRAYDPS